MHGNYLGSKYPGYSYFTNECIISTNKSEISKCLHFIIPLQNRGFAKSSLLNYVPYVLSCPTCLVPYVLSCLTCLTCSRVSRASCPTCSRTFVPYVFRALRALCPMCSRASRASCPTCSRVLRAPCPTYSRAQCVSYPMWSRALCLVSPFFLRTPLPVLLSSDDQYLSTIWIYLNYLKLNTKTYT